MNKIVLCLLIVFGTYAYVEAQKSIFDLSKQLADKKVTRTKLPVTISFTRIDSSTKDVSIHESKLKIGNYQGKYLIFAKYNSTAIKTYGVLVLNNKRYSLENIYDDITGEKLPTQFIYGMLEASYIELYNRRYLCLLSTTSTFGSLSLRKSVYLLDLSKEKVRDYYFIMRYGYELNFGDFNNDQILDVYTWLSKPELCQSNSKEFIRDCIQAKAYSLGTSKVEPLNTPHKVLVKVKEDYSVDILHYKWFY